jgi:tripartite-type tricarboxylate transporter receptor subunit TctC
MKSYLACAALAAACVAPLAVAQEAYPTRPIQVILPLQVGSASDIAVRVVAERLTEILGQNVVVENVTGVGGHRREPPSRPRADGTTLAAMNAHSHDPAAHQAQVKFDTLPTTCRSRTRQYRPSSAYRDLPVSNVRLIALAGAARRPELLDRRTGSPQHLATEMFMDMTGVKLTHVPYKGATAATADLAAGRVQVMFVAHSLALPYLPNERIKLIAFAGGERSKAMPNIPTVAESGVPGFDYASWVALFALKGTPPEVVAKLRDATAKAMATPGLADRLAKSGLEIWDTPADVLTKVIREDWARWEKVVKAAGLAEN